MTEPRRRRGLALPRGTGRPRRDRRALRRGGEGVGAALNQVVGAWEGVRITPMFGRWGYFVGEHLFGCYPVRVKDHDLWVRLSRSDQVRALAGTGVRPHRRFAARGWIECDVADPGELSRALKWLRHGYEYVRRAPPLTPPSARD
ncbi:MAG TPA: luciferase family protein [Methylomirabilota bacterium]|nr:luciferase family protein [Methylomirabilota bacterium]